MYTDNRAVKLDVAVTWMLYPCGCAVAVMHHPLDRGSAASLDKTLVCTFINRLALIILPSQHPLSLFIFPLCWIWTSNKEMNRLVCAEVFIRIKAKEVSVPVCVAM